MKIISPKLHGIIDYLVVVFLLASPILFGLSHEIGLYTYALAVVHLLLTILTDFNAGLLKVIPLPIHGFIELIVGVALIIIAFTLLKNDMAAHMFYAGFGIAVLAVYLLSDYRKQVKP